LTEGGAVSGSRRGLRSLGGALVLLLAGASILAAAPARKPKPAPSGSRERPDVFGGYSFVQSGSANLHGGQVSASYPLGRSLSLVADVSGHYGSYAGADLTELDLLAGGRRYWRWRGLSPFAQVLVGGVRHKASAATPDGAISSTGTDLGVAPGFGADYRLTPRWAARLGVDLRLVHGGGWEADPRVSAGAVYRFGRR